MALTRCEIITRTGLSQLADKFSIRGFKKGSLQKKIKDFKILEIENDKIIFTKKNIKLFNTLLKSAKAKNLCNDFFISKYLEKIIEEYNKL
ncbi:MAG: hypothetical protein ACTSRA_06635 [Promethearchaeota archaeon]